MYKLSDDPFKIFKQNHPEDLLGQKNKLKRLKNATSFEDIEIQQFQEYSDKQAQEKFPNTYAEAASEARARIKFHLATSFQRSIEQAI